MSDYVLAENTLLAILDEKSKEKFCQPSNFTNLENFKCWYSYFTDYTLQEFARKICNENTTEIDLTGNDYLTDQGIIWMCKNLKYSSKIKTILLRSCSKLTEMSLFAIINKLRVNVKVDMSHTNIKYVPKEILENFEIITSNCLLTLQPSMQTTKSYSIIMWPSKSIQFSGTSLFSDFVEKPSAENYFEHLVDLKMTKNLPSLNIINYRLTEVPSHMLITSKPGQIVIVLNDDTEEACSHLIESVTFFLASAFSTIGCPKITPSSFEKLQVVFSDDRTVTRPKQKIQIKKKAVQVKNEEIVNMPLLDHPDFGYKNVSVQQNQIKHLRDTGVWVSKKSFGYTTSVLGIKSSQNIAMGHLIIGFCRLKREIFENSNPKSDALFYYDVSQKIITYKKEKKMETFNIKQAFSCLFVSIEIKCKTEDSLNKTFVAIQIDEIQSWSHVFILESIEDLVPFITMNQRDCSIELSGDWQLNLDSISSKEMEVETAESSNLMKFIVLCYGANCQKVYDDIIQLDWSLKLKGFVDNLQELISNIKEKSSELIDFNDCLKLSEAYRQLEQLNDFIKDFKERISFFKTETINKQVVSELLSCIENNIEKEMAICPFRYTSNVLDAIGQKIIQSGKNYVTMEFLNRVNVAKSTKVSTEIFEKLFAEGRGFYIKKFQFFILNIKWFDSILADIISKMPNESNYRVHGVHRNCKVWDYKNLIELFSRFQIEPKDNSMWIEFIMDLGILIKLPCIRKSINDEFYLFVNPMAEGTGKKLHLDYIKSVAELISHKFEVKVKYKKVFQDLYSIYPQFLSKIVSIGQLQLISPVATVIHISGGIELLIESELDCISMTIYFKPPEMSQPSSKFNMNIMDYIRSVMHLCTDSFEAILSQQNILSNKISSIPKESLKNYSVCYNHKWVNDVEFNNICSLCGNCSSVDGIECPYNRIISQRKGVCLCLKQSRICGSCGICQSCAANHWKNHCESDPNRLIICNANYVNVPTRPISQFMGSKFTVDIYQENSNTFAGLLINDTDIMVDIFGITNSCKNGAAIFADNLNNIPSPLPISVLSFEISESYFYKSDLYQFSKCSGINVLQELGILTYNNETEVSLVVGKFPVSPDRRRFSMEILNPGASGRITIGLVPANYSVIQPGWRENSLAYHGDDGGIFLGESVPQIIRETFSEVNNCIEVIIEYESSLDSPELVRHITWRKNGKFVEKILIQHDKELYPAIGMHSINEQVRLLDFEVWADTECSSNVENNIKIENTVTVSPESIIYLEANEGFSGIFYIIPKTDLMKSLEFKIFHKYDGTETVGWMLESHNKLLNSNKTPGKWLFDIFSNSNIEFFTFGLKTSITTNIHDWMLKLTVLTTTDKSKTFQWQLSSCDWLVMSNENVFSIKEVPDQHTVAAKPSLLLTTTLNSSVDLEKPDLRKTNTSGQIRYYHIPIADYKLFFRADKQNAWIRCSNYMKPNFTRSFQIGNLIALDKIPALILQVNKSKEQLKLSGKDELINFNDSRLKPIMQSGKPLLSLKLSKNRKYNQFSITNKGLLSVPTPSRPWLFAFNWENDNTFPIDELYFSTDCSEYHGMNICLLNSISTVEEEVPPNDKLDNIVTLPFNQNEKEMENFLWEHSMLHLISWDKLLFYPFCPGKSTIYDSKPHLVNTEGIELFEVNSSPSEICKAVFFNPKLLLCHKLILNYKFLLPKYNRILRKEITDFSQDEIEYLIFSILNKITSYMVLTNLFFDEKYAFTQSLKVNWNKYFENNNNHSLVLESHGVSCKLHSSLYDEQINLDDIIGAPETNQKDNEIIMENHSIFDYAKCSQSIILSGKTVKELPAELFVKFINLCSLELRNMFQLKCLPRTIYSLKGLQRLIINQVKINTLPDIYEFPNLKYLQIEKCPIKTYNDSNECLKLETLKLLALPLQTISNFICLQENLVVVELQLHGIESLPDEFGRLENMKELKLIGSPLYYELLKNDFIIKSDNLEFEYPEIGFYKVKENDKNPISFLPVADIFINVPRIGSGYSEPVDVNSHGGFPMAILQLKKLITLVIQHQSIRYVPDSIQQLENLEILDLSYNPLLEKVSAQISSIISIKQLILVHCPSISVPPPEIIARGTSLSYLKYLLAKTVVCNRTKLMFVGLGEAGKTSLLHALRSDENSAKEIIEQQEKQVTDGIDITKWTVICHNEEIQYSAWDFAGQDVYYNTHQFFLSEKAIYIVVWSVRQGIEHGDLDFWLSSISCHSKYAPVFVVGTRCDQKSSLLSSAFFRTLNLDWNDMELNPPILDMVQADMSCFSSLKKRYSQIEDFILVDSLSGTGIKDLKQKLIHVTLNLPYMHQAIPSTILDLENQFTSIRSQKNYITYQEFQNIAISQGIFEKDVKSVIQILHDFGSIQYFDTEILKNYVVINPQWIVDIMANVVSVVNQKIKNGIFYHENMKDVWDKFESKLFNWMLNLTEEFDLTFPHPTMEPKANIVPCLLSEEEPEIEWPKFSEQTLCKFYHINYKFEFLPAGLFNRIQVRLFDFTEAKKLWKYGMYFEKNGHHVLFMRENKSSLIVRAIGVRPVNVLAMVDDVIKGLVKASFHGVRYNLEISCPDCIEYGNNISNDATKYWSNISMIPSKLIKKALIKKVEYLQCEELHLNSIKSIKENTPETASAEEFINDLISKVQTVKSLYASSDKLVTFLHSTKDLTDLSAMPMKEFDNLFSDCNIVCIKINETSEVKWKTSISNCQLCLICLSENFIQIPKMNEMLEYIKLLKKKFILLILSSDKEIRQKWEYYPYFMTVFIKINATHPKASTEKILEIKKAIQDSIVSSTVNETAGETYDCFVSYCWANSQDAVNKGTKAIPGAIISPDADPRKLARYLIDNGIKCWIDDSHMDKTSGLNSQLSLNLRNSKMMLAFVSDEYDKSDNCKMELNFMVEELRRPVSYVLVGSNMEWRFNSEVGLIMQKRHRSEILDFTNNNNISESRLLEELKVRLRNCPDIAYEKNDQNKIQGHNTALMEQLELISRQILNQLISFITDNCPRLIVIDVDPDDGTDSQIDNDIIMDSTLQSSLRASVSGNKLVLKVICEGETNWHIADEAYPLSIEDKDEIIEKCAVYLYMIYQVFEYKNPGLRCLQPDNISNMEFITKITQIAGSSTMTFKESYSNMVKYYMKYDPKIANCSLERYRLPSGREFWMCKKHADQNPRCKLIERDRAAIDTFAIPIDNYDTSLLGDIKSKISSDTLQHNDSFHSIVQRFKTTDAASNRTTKHDLILPKKKLFFRSDTILNLEKDIVTNKKDTYDIPIRISSEVNARNVYNQIPSKPVNRRLSAMNRPNLVGSRICTIQ